jgi:hypothetical protein
MIVGMRVGTVVSSGCHERARASGRTRFDIIALLTLIVAIITALFTVKEFRQFLGLEKPEKAIIIDNRRPTSSPTANPRSVPTNHKSEPFQATRESIVTPPPTPSSTAHSQPSPAEVPSPSKPQVEPGLFIADVYTLRAEGMQKRGDSATLTLSLEATGSQPAKFLMGNCYGLDENGGRWEQKDYDKNPFTWGFGRDLLPDTRQRIELQFAVPSPNAGSIFALACSENYPQSGRRIILYKIPIR